MLQNAKQEQNQIIFKYNKLRQQISQITTFRFAKDKKAILATDSPNAMDSPFYKTFTHQLIIFEITSLPINNPSIVHAKLQLCFFSALKFDRSNQFFYCIIPTDLYYYQIIISSICKQLYCYKSATFYQTYPMLIRTSLSFIAFTLLIILSTPALNQLADEAIKEAIRQAVLDGLNVVENYTRTNFWYYLQGGERVTYNVTIRTYVLNYIVVYKTNGLYYQVICDLDKITWKSQVNSFVKLEGRPSSLNISNASLMDSSNKKIDITKEMSQTAAKNSTVEVSSKNEQKSTQPIETIPASTPKSGIIVVSSKDADLTSQSATQAPAT